MGLDITAYKSIKKLGSCENYDDYEKQFDEYDTLYIVNSNKYFPGMMSGIETNDVYSYEDMYDFRAGSYSGYNRWRELLCKTMVGVLPSLVWGNKDCFKGGPFIELINFTDCDGIIGPEMCKKLHKDFIDNKDTIDNRQDVGDDLEEYFERLYLEWCKAFEFASQDGCLVFN